MDVERTYIAHASPIGERRNNHFVEAFLSTIRGLNLVSENFCFEHNFVVCLESLPFGLLFYSRIHSTLTLRDIALE